MRLNSYNLALSNDLNGTNDGVSANCDNETHVAVLGDRRISLQQDPTQADVIAQGVKFGNGRSEAKFQVDRIVQAESPVLTFLRTRSSASTGQLCHDESLS